MDFRLSADQEQIVQAVRELAREYGLDYWREKDRQHAFIEELWRALSEGGWLGLTIPEAYEGGGLGMLEAALVIETVAAAGAGLTVAQFFMYTLLQAATILRHGNDEQRRRYLPRLAAGKLRFALAVTEANAGSNTLATQTTAVRRGDEYLVNGQKVFISGLEQADGMFLVARTTPLEQVSRKTAGLSVFLVPTSSDGIERYPIEKLGTHCMASWTVYLNDVRVRAENLVGEEGRGWQYLVDTLNVERIITTAGAIGTVELVHGLAAEYGRTRVVFDRPIGANQGLQFPLARTKAEAEAARLLNHKAAWLFDQGLPCASEGNIAKLLATEAAFAACDHAMQMFGGYGYTSEYHIERLWRDARLFRIAPVSQEMLLNFIAQHDLGLPRSY